MSNLPGHEDGEGDGDLGLQELSLDDSSSISPRLQARATFGAMFRFFGGNANDGSVAAHEPAAEPGAAFDPLRGGQGLRRADAEQGAKSTDSTFSQYHSANDHDGVASTTLARGGVKSAKDSNTQNDSHSREQDKESTAKSSSALRDTSIQEPPAPQTQAGAFDASAQEDKPVQKERLQGEAVTQGTSDSSLLSSVPQGSSSSSPSSASLDKQKHADERKVQRRISRLHNNIAGPIAQRPVAGSANGPTVAPRRTSALRSNSTSSTSSSSSRRLSSASPALSPIRRASDGLSTYANGQKTKDGSAPAVSASASSSVVVQEQQRLAGTDGNVMASGSPQLSQRVSFAPRELGQRGLGIDSIREHNGQGTVADGLPREDAASAKLKDNSPSAADHPGRNDESTLLDVGALQRWVLSIGCVNFDLDKGPDLEFLYPSLGISREERDNIAFSSFPDTSIFDDGSAVFSWRVREVPLHSSDNEAPVIASPMPVRAGETGRASLSLRKTPSPLPLDAKGSSTWSRKGASARRFLGGSSDRDQRREGSTSPGFELDIEADERGDRSTAARKEREDDKRETLALPKRSDSAASTPSSVSNDHQIDSATSDSLKGSITSAPRVASPLPTAEQAPAAAASTVATLPKRRNTSTSTHYIHGYCFFRQKRDATIRRGYFQKSVVILSHLPYVSFFTELVRRLGPLFFENGMPTLETFCHDVQNWPTPEPGARMHLPLLGSVISVELPFHSLSQASALLDAPHSTSSPRNASSNTQKSGADDVRLIRTTDGSRENAPILASIPNTPMVQVFRESIDDLWLLWECLLLAEPVLVVGPDPTACSEAVWHMLNLIKPIPLAGDFRPFFTIHDYDFQTLVTKNRPSSGVIIGVTNPFMLQACKHWPHVLRVGRGAVKRSQHAKRSSTVDASNGVSGGIAGGNSAGGGGPEHTPGLTSKRKRRISKERTLIKQINDLFEGKNAGSSGTSGLRSIEQANESLSAYFADLTERFLAPLNRFVSSLIPSDFDLNSPNETPRIKPFNTTEFLQSVKQHGTPLPLKSRNLPTGAAIRQSIYLDFVQCPNFSLWLHSRIRQSQEEQYLRKLAALTSGNVATFASTKGEVESIELYARLNVEIQGINERLIAGRKERELKPNSRWKSPVASVSGGNAAKSDASFDGGRSPREPEAADVSQQRLLLDDNSDCIGGMSPIAPRRSSFTISGLSQANTPLARLVAFPATQSSAFLIRQTLSEPGWTRSFTQFERTLLIRKAGLIDQLHRLLSTLPQDLRQTLQLKERGRHADA